MNINIKILIFILFIIIECCILFFTEDKEKKKKYKQYILYINNGILVRVAISLVNLRIENQFTSTFDSTKFKSGISNNLGMIDLYQLSTLFSVVFNNLIWAISLTI